MKQMQYLCDVGSSNGARGRVGCLLVILLVVICLCPQHALSADEQHRDVDQPHPGSASSANRLADDQRAQRDQPKAAMASLLLKNLRFRDLQRRLLDEGSGTGDTADLEQLLTHALLNNNYLTSPNHQHQLLLSLPANVRKRLTADDLVRVLNSKKPGGDQGAGERLPTLRFAMKKRQSVSVSELTQLLQNNKMKARNAPEENVKLQSLRFGRR